MEYEIVNLEQKIIVGVSAETSNNSPDMGTVIGGLWGKFYQGGVHEQIKNRVNEFAIGLYSDYVGDKYCVTVGNEVSDVDESNKKLTVKTIPSGKYAKFSICGNMVTAVQHAWQQIWDMDLDRSFTGDFEEYKNADVEHAEVDIYVALKN